MKRKILGVLTALVLLLLAALAAIRPSNQRAWSTGQERAPYATFNGSRVTIHDVRNFEWRKDGSAVERWEDRTYDLNELETAWFALAPFERTSRGPAHTFLSFGFSDSQFVAISIEARREEDERYSLLKGVLRRFEVLYVIGDERDLIRMRTNIRDDDVYLYPIRTSPEKARRLFVEMLERATHLRQHPEFYNTLTNNCTTNILDHANRITPGKVPYGKEVLLPGYADELAQRLGLIDDDVPIEVVRARYLINARALKHANDPRFSIRIRETEEPRSQDGTQHIQAEGPAGDR
jgi:hypothetical protein